MGKSRQFKFKRSESPGIGQIWNLLSWMWINATLLMHGPLLCGPCFTLQLQSIVVCKTHIFEQNFMDHSFQPIFSISVHSKLFTKLPFCFIVKKVSLLFSLLEAIYILHDLLLSHTMSVSPPEFKTKGPMHNHDIAKISSNRSGNRPKFALLHCWQK